MGGKQSLFFSLLLIAFLFWLGLSQFGLGFSGNDSQEHISMAVNPEYSPGYAPLFRLVSPLFVVQGNMFAFLGFFLLIVVPCWLLFRITKEPWCVVFWFACSSVFYFLLASLYGQLLVFIAILGLLAFKDNRIRASIVFVFSLAHTWAFVLLPLVWLVIVLNELWGLKIRTGLTRLISSLPKMALGIGGCSPFWGRTIPSVLNDPVGGSGYVPSMISLNKLLAFGIKVAPLPFVFVAFKEFFRRGRFDLMFFWVLGFFGAWFFGDRVWYLSGLVTIIGFSWAWKTLEHRRFWLVLVLFYLVFLFQQFVWGRLFC